MMLLLLIPLRLFCFEPPVNHFKAALSYYNILVERSVNQQIKTIYNAVTFVESRHNDLAVNIKEQAYGRAQIRQIRLNDYYKRTGKRYTLKQMHDNAKSFEVFEYYAKLLQDDELIIKRWNGSGPMTIAYYAKVKKALSKLSIN